MNPDENTAQEEELADLLALLDEALAAGVPLSLPLGQATSTDMTGLAEDLACLQLLNQLRPRFRGALTPATRVTLFGEAPSKVSAPDARLGTQLGKYRIIARLGKGGMGVVYEAEDSLLKRKVAIKLLPEAVSADPQALRRFLMEAQAVARLHHPNVVLIYEVAQQDDNYAIVMELVRGSSLQELLAAEGLVHWPEATRMIADACRGLAAAHAAGLIHRDIKPQNLMCSADGAVKLVDFGLAKTTHSSATPLTKAGSVVGTPEYMSPEQCRSETLNERSDIYSLGATYYSLLVGEPPYLEGTALQVMFAHCEKPVPDPRAHNPHIPSACAAIVQRAMAKEPSARFVSAAKMLASLESVLAAAPAAASESLATKQIAVLSTTPTKPLMPVTAEPRQVQSRRRGLIAGLGGLLLILGAVSWHFTVNRGPTGPGPSARGSSTERDNSLSLAKGKMAPTWESEMDGPLRAVAFSPDGNWLAAAGGEVRVWQCKDGKCAPKPHAILWKEQAIRSLAFSGDSTILAAAGSAGGGRDGAVKLWHVAGGPLPALEDLAGEGRAVAFSPDGKTLAAGIHQGAIVVVKVWGWNAKELSKPIDLLGHTKAFTSLAFSPDSRQLFTGGQDGVVKVWNTSTEKCLKELPTQPKSGGINALAFCEFDNKLCVDTETTIEVYKSDNWQVADNWKLDYALPPEEMQQAAPYHSVAVAGEWAAHGTRVAVTLFHIPANQSYFLNGHAGAVPCVAFSTDGRFLATGGADRMVRLWDARHFRTALRPVE